MSEFARNLSVRQDILARNGDIYGLGADERGEALLAEDGDEQEPRAQAELVLVAQLAAWWAGQTIVSHSLISTDTARPGYRFPLPLRCTIAPNAAVRASETE